jgi:hypothetical protein
MPLVALTPTTHFLTTKRHETTRKFKGQLPERILSFRNYIICSSLGNRKIQEEA